ncbi:hypothetical protein L218DRAFT_986628 [Marasmius fiardii PR-910]|nr:hypothetical protein L218DRAFT_986628 [Marasmius fiardii PR-910]
MSLTNFLVAVSPPSPSPSTSITSANKSRPRRPKGLWKARVTLTVTEPRFLNFRPYHHEQRSRRFWEDHDPDTDDDDSRSSTCTSTSSNKKPRLSSPVTDDGEDDDNSSNYLWDFTHSPPPSPIPEDYLHPFGFASDHCKQPKSTEKKKLVKRTRIMDISSVAATSSSVGRSTALFNYEDWEDLKDLFASAAEQYETAEPSEAIPLIRGVIHECHRFQKDYQDPSTLFANPGGSRAHSPSRTPPDERVTGHKDWTARTNSPTVATGMSTSPSERKKCTCLELPTAFHNIFGTALFLFGNLIAQDPSLCLPGEPNSPNAYWMAALDVFETGENLPTRTHGLGACEAPEDWRMAIVWGRTLVCLADERIVKDRDKSEESPRENATTSTSQPVYQTQPLEPNWEPDSPFSIIAQRRPPVTGRMSLTTASPNELLKLAMDQFSRGIFHMPHPEQHASIQFSSSSTSPNQHFSRAKELFTIASEVLLVSEKLSDPGERRYWASWADSVFDQMKMESSSPSHCYAERIDHARGRCCLIAGSALSEQFEDALERGEMDVLDSEDAEEAREFLTEAVGFFEKARRGREMEKKDWEKNRKGKGKEKEKKLTRKRKREDTDDDDIGGEARKLSSSDETEEDVGEETAEGEEAEEDEDDELQDLLAESLLTLANLTRDEQKREELYARAERESRSGLGLGVERMTVDDL